MKHYIFTLSLLLMSSLSVYAQGEIEMATGLRSSGKIWVVVLVLLIVFFGIAAYLFTLDKKISKLEKHNK
ncbi:CcmD family protein [Sphingobacterium sp. SYP-B4668]|uniref:CcmD family protein n=1 Tax=Sphingobacterium sp. SYP-B4668 TaxID=2996035 RepID=UPI00053254D8|nr:CcmD family protein [Sphingobacterium sp. SYP-B4668]